jgi:hypothetical protein
VCRPSARFAMRPSPSTPSGSPPRSGARRVSCGPCPPSLPRKPRVDSRRVSRSKRQRQVVRLMCAKLALPSDSPQGPARPVAMTHGNHRRWRKEGHREGALRAGHTLQSGWRVAGSARVGEHETIAAIRLRTASTHAVANSGRLRALHRLATSTTATDALSFAKTPSGGQVVDRSALIMPRANRSGRRSPCLHGVDPGDNSTVRAAFRVAIHVSKAGLSRWE